MGQEVEYLSYSDFKKEFIDQEIKTLTRTLAGIDIVFSPINSIPKTC